MASSVPYAAPYTRSTAPARPVVRVDGPLARFLSLLMVAVLFYVVVQLSLASVASGILQESVRLDQENALAQRERDALQAQVATYKSPAYIEMKAREKGYGPLTNIEFER